MAEFRLGFKNLADELGTDVVGEPITDEQPFKPDELTVQFTGQGLKLFHKPTGRPYFFDGARRDE